MILSFASILLAAATPLFSLPTEQPTTMLNGAITDKESTEPTTWLPTEEVSSTTPLTTTTKTVDTTDKIEIMNTTVPRETEIALTIEGEANMLKVLSASDERFMDHEVRWLVVEKTTHIDKEEESFYDRRSGKTQRKSSENRREQLKVLRDDRYGSDGNEVNYMGAFQM